MGRENVFLRSTVVAVFPWGDSGSDSSLTFLFLFGPASSSSRVWNIGNLSASARNYSGARRVVPTDGRQQFFYSCTIAMR